MPSVSVIIPSYNHESFLAGALRSVLEPSASDLEVIVVDDGSTDGSRDILRRLAGERVRIFLQENRGAHEAINRGLREAKGDHLAILNSDDAFHPDRVARCLQACREGADLVTSWVEVMDSEGRSLGVKRGWTDLLPWPLGPIDDISISTRSFVGSLLSTNFVATTSNAFFTRKLWEEVGGMRPLRFAHDWDFFLRCARRHNCVLLEEPLVRYRIHGRNTIASDREWMLFEICWILAAHLGSGAARSAFPQADARSLLRWLSAAVNAQEADRTLWLLLAFLAGLDREAREIEAVRLLEDRELRRIATEGMRGLSRPT